MFYHEESEEYYSQEEFYKDLEVKKQQGYRVRGKPFMYVNERIISVTYIKKLNPDKETVAELLGKKPNKGGLQVDVPTKAKEPTIDWDKVRFLTDNDHPRNDQYWAESFIAGTNTIDMTQGKVAKLIKYGMKLGGYYEDVVAGLVQQIKDSGMLDHPAYMEHRRQLAGMRYTIWEKGLTNKLKHYDMFIADILRDIKGWSLDKKKSNGNDLVFDLPNGEQFMGSRAECRGIVLREAHNLNKGIGASTEMKPIDWNEVKEPKQDVWTEGFEDAPKGMYSVRLNGMPTEDCMVYIHKGIKYIQFTGNAKIMTISELIVDYPYSLQSMTKI